MVRPSTDSVSFAAAVLLVGPADAVAFRSGFLTSFHGPLLSTFGGGVASQKRPPPSNYRVIFDDLWTLTSLILNHFQ